MKGFELYPDATKMKTVGHYPEPGSYPEPTNQDVDGLQYDNKDQLSVKRVGQLTGTVSSDGRVDVKYDEFCIVEHATLPKDTDFKR